MITVTSEAKVAKVQVFGVIGEGFFTDGVTIDNFKAQINGDFDEIEMEISSLGGNLIQALAIYDTLRTTKARVTARIIGATASAGTVIAMGADKIEISENSNFLIHQASTIAAGNVEDMEAAAAELALFDEQMLNIYQKRTGKRKTQVANLMKEDKWITPKEALEWGFVDSIMKTKNPILNKSDMDTTKIKELLNVTTDEAIEAAVEALISNSKVNADKLAEIEAKETAKIQAEQNQYIETAFAEGRITAEAKEKYIALAVNSFEDVKVIIDSIRPIKVADYVQPDPEPETKVMTKAEAQTIYNGWQAKNKVARNAEENPELYNQVITALKS